MFGSLLRCLAAAVSRRLLRAKSARLDQTLVRCR
jgi:hypothetical protein